MADEKDNNSNPNNVPVKSMADMFKPIKYGLAAKREKAKEEFKNLNPDDCETRIGILFDDSGSMSGQPLKDAKTGVQGFTNNCNPKDIALSIFPLNKDAQGLTCNYDLLNLYVSSIPSTGGTPLYTVTTKLLETRVTRAILFSDGDPTDHGHEEVIALALKC